MQKCTFEMRWHSALKRSELSKVFYQFFFFLFDVPHGSRELAIQEHSIELTTSQESIREWVVRFVCHKTVWGF